MKKLIIFTLVFLAFSTLKSQIITFSKLYDLSFVNGALNCMVKENGEIVVPAGILSTEGRAIVFLTINAIGEEIKTSVLWDSTYAFYRGRSNSTHQIKDKIVSCGEVSNYVTQNFSAVLYFYDEINNEITYQLFSDTVTTRFRSCIPTPDGGLMAFGEKRLTADNRDFLLVKYDSLFQEEWVRTFGQNNVIETGFFIGKYLDGGYLLSGLRDVNNYLILVNDTGKLVFQKTYNVNYGACKSMQISDSSIIMTTTSKRYFPEVSGLGVVPTIRKVTKLGDIVWEKYLLGNYDGEMVSRPWELNNGNIVACGFQQGQGNNLKRVVSFMAFFSPAGDSLWKHHFYYDSLVNGYLYDLQQTPDGGFVMVGFSHGQDQDVWVVKVDSNGCLLPGCLNPTGINEEVLTGKLSVTEVYPNPATNHFTVQLPQKFSGQATIFDVNGKLHSQLTFLHSQNLVYQVNQWPPGIYFIQIETLTGERFVKRFVVGSN